MAKRKNPKIVKYRRHSVNVGGVVFAIIFIYMIFSIYIYMKKDKIQFYEVVEGSIVNDHAYTGLILRQESVQSTDRAGYVSYYVREGKRAAVGTSIYSIDESGSLASYLEENPDANVTLTDANLADIKRQLSSFSMGYQDVKFDAIYDLQYSLEAAVLEDVNFNTLENLDAVLSQTGISFQQFRTPVSGVISYGIDGYEALDAAQVTADTFNRAGYSKTIAKAGELIGESVPVYKVISSDAWSILFPLTEDTAAEYADKTKLHVTFASNHLEADGAFSMFTGADGAQYGRLDFDKYMVQFAADRFVDFEVDTERIDGLKIPVSSVTEKTFFLVPLEYLSNGGDSSDSGFLKEVYSEAGTSYEFVPATIYYANEESCYIDMGENAPLQAGDYIIKPDSQDRYQIGPTASLQGVYNINKGYAVFKQIEILNTNDEYYTVRKGTSYGLSVYDHIVLNAGTVYEGQLIYQ